MPSVSPDGRYLTFSAVGPEGKRMLWLRPLDALHATVIQGSEGASAPFWSPDSQSIAFFGGKYLKKVKITGGAPEDICQAEASPGGGSWNEWRHPLRSRPFRGLLPCAGHRRKAATGDQAGRIEIERADLWPQFLPDGTHFVFYQQTDLAESSGVYVGALDHPEYHRLFDSQTNAVYSPLSPNSPKVRIPALYPRAQSDGAAVQFWPPEIAGDPITLANDIGAVRSLALAPISVSTTGVLVYQGVGQPTRQMVWMDRGGKQMARRRARRRGPAGISPTEPRGRRQDRLGRQDRRPLAARIHRRRAADFGRTDARRLARLVARRYADCLLRQAGRQIRYVLARRAVVPKANCS